MVLAAIVARAALVRRDRRSQAELLQPAWAHLAPRAFGALEAWRDVFLSRPGAAERAAAALPWTAGVFDSLSSPA